MLHIVLFQTHISILATYKYYFYSIRVFWQHIKYCFNSIQVFWLGMYTILVQYECSGYIGILFQLYMTIFRMCLVFISLIFIDTSKTSELVLIVCVLHMSEWISLQGVSKFMCRQGMSEYMFVYKLCNLEY